MAYALPDLPYAYDALEPHIDARTMEIHHAKHHQTYVTSLNKAIEGHPKGNLDVHELLTMLDTLPEGIRAAVRNHGGGHANHCLFWTIMSPRGGGAPHGGFARALDRELGEFQRFRDELTEAALRHFGSGWAWPSVDPEGRLHIESTSNQDSPVMHGHTPVLGIDVWERAYYLKYQNRRADYVAAFYNVIDWDAVGERYRSAVRQLQPVAG